MEAKYRLNIVEQSRPLAPRTELTDATTNGADRRETSKDDVIATKEVEVGTLLCLLQ